MLETRRSAGRRRRGLLLIALLLCAACDARQGRLQLTIVDEDGQPTPARVSLIDESGRAWIADDALPVRADCAEHWPPPAGPSAVLPPGDRAVWDPYTDTMQFYSDGTSTAALPAGDYRITVRKGLEYAATTGTASVAAHGIAHLRLNLRRWVDMASTGWLGSDDHLHIARMEPGDDPKIAAWMEAEDLDVANLLAMGTPEGVRAAPQRSFGLQSAFTEGVTTLLSGQENPRSNNFGHVILLGAPAYIDFPERYLVYNEFMRAAARDGGLSGYAHFGTTGARNGLAVDAPEGLVDFLEVLQTRRLETAVLYEMWNLGIRLTPTAGTDYPCGGIASLPGQERFYAAVREPRSPRAWLDAIDAGRTFVTNGPMLSFTVEERGIGDVVELERPGPVRVRGEVRYDPARERIDTLELVHDGDVIATSQAKAAPGRLSLEATPTIDATGWLALRATGERVRAVANGTHAAVFAHTGAIEVDVPGTPALDQQEAGQDLLRESLQRIDGLDAFIRKARIPEADREGLLAAIAAARDLYRSRLGPR